MADQFKTINTVNILLTRSAATLFGGGAKTAMRYKAEIWFNSASDDVEDPKITIEGTSSASSTDFAALERSAIESALELLTEAGRNRIADLVEIAGRAPEFSPATTFDPPEMGD